MGQKHTVEFAGLIYKRPAPADQRFTLQAASLLLCALLILTATGVNAQFTLNVTVNTVEVAPGVNSSAYEMSVFTSVTDDSGLPIKQLSADEFSLLEDSQPVEFSLHEATDVPINLVLVIDTSGSMAGTGIAQAKEAATKFIKRLGAQDRVGLIMFNSKVTNLSDFTSDTNALTTAVAGINVVPSSGTCLYDAIYEAVQMSSVLPSGRRAVLVFTDGRDELPDGSVCSSMQIDDVIQLASTTPNTPVHAIGIGKELDEKALDRMALLTGGSFLKSEAFSPLDALFGKVFDQLKYKYELKYQSNAAPGRHILTVQVNLSGNKDEDTRNFTLPDVPAKISFGNVLENQQIGSPTLLLVQVLGSPENIQSVEFAANNQVLATDAEYPFEYRLDPGNFAAGNLSITARALSRDGSLVDSAQVNVQIVSSGAVIPAPQMTESPALNPPSGSDETDQGLLGRLANLPVPLQIAIGAVALILILFIVVMVVRLLKAKRGGGILPRDDDEPVMETMILRKPSSDLATLTVINSDDSTLVGQSIPITNKTSTIGRGTGNDIMFPKDHPVSRKHVTLEYKDGVFTLSEVLKSGDKGLESPTFGTFVNEKNIHGNAVQLRKGDIIRLGNRLKLEFTPQVEERASKDSDRTMDDIQDEAAE